MVTASAAISYPGSLTWVSKALLPQGDCWQCPGTLRPPTVAILETALGTLGLGYLTIGPIS